MKGLLLGMMLAAIGCYAAGYSEGKQHCECRPPAIWPTGVLAETIAAQGARAERLGRSVEFWEQVRARSEHARRRRHHAVP